MITCSPPRIICGAKGITPGNSARPLLLAILSLCLWGCGQASPPPPPPPSSVTTAAAIFRPLRQWDDFTGRLEAIESVEIRARVNGYIDSVGFSDGQEVHRGQLLYQIDPRPYQDEVDRLAAALQQAQARAVLAKSDADRAQRLIDQNAVSQGEYERQEEVSKSAIADVASARASLAAARLNLSYTRVVSPIDGRISKAIITRGNLVSSSNLLTTVMSDRPIYAAFNADEQVYLKYASNQRDGNGPVFVGLIDEDGYPHRGRLHFLDNAVDSGSGTILGRAVLDNADGKMTPGLFARVRLVSNTASMVALVPEQSLGTDLGKRFVMVVDKSDHVITRPVDLGVSLGELRVVRSGLNPGDRVVVDGLQKIKSGDLVKPQTVQIDLPPDVLGQLALAQ